MSTRSCSLKSVFQFIFLAVIFLFAVSILFMGINNIQAAPIGPTSIRTSTPTRTPKGTTSTPTRTLTDTSTPTRTPTDTSTPTLTETLIIQPVEYTLLQEEAEPSSVVGCKDNQIYDDYQTVTQSDGYRWEFQLLPPTRNNVHFQSYNFQLYIEFVCEGSHGEVVVLAKSIEPWQCSSSNSMNPVSVVGNYYKFGGNGGLDCAGRSVKQVIEGIFNSDPHNWRLDLDTHPIATHLYGKAFLSNPCNASGTIGSLFKSSDFGYSIKKIAESSASSVLHHTPPIPDLPLSATSTSFAIPTGTFELYSYRNVKTGNINHELNGALVSSTDVASSYIFRLSTTTTTVQIGYDGVNYYCGNIEKLFMDPYSVITGN